jgi:vitamin B12 transporter
MRYVVLLSCVVAANAVAQTQTDTVQLPPVTVTATRIPIRLDLVSSSVTVITAAELRAAGYKTVADVLRSAGSAALVETGSFGGQTSLFLRGGESDYVKVLLDGVPLNQPGGAFDFADLSLDNVERIEVVRGPGSVLYGSDAMTGVIQIFTRAGAGQLRVTGEARAGTYGAAQLGAGVAGGARTVTYSFGAERFAADGVLPFNNQYERSSGSARLRVAPDSRAALDLSLHYGDATYHYPTDDAGNPVDSNTLRFERGPAWTADLEYALSERVTVRFTYGAHDVRQGIDDRADGPADTIGFYGFESRERVRRTSVGTRVDWRLPRNSVVTLGSELERQRIDATSESQSEFGPFTDPPLHERRRNDALYVQALTGLDGPLTLQGGVRLDQSDQVGRFITFRSGLVYRVDAATRLRAAVGTGFKEPTFFENFATGFVHGNPDLKPERTRSWEAGIEHRVGRATMGVTYFDQQFSDLIEFTFTPAPPDTINYFNVTGASADGVETVLRADLGAGWTVGLTYTYLDSRVTDPGFATDPDAAFAPGKRLIRRPSHQATLQLHAPLAARGSGNVTVRYTGQRDDLDFTSSPASRVTLRAAVCVDLGAEYDLPLGSPPALTLSLRVENLFNDDARDAANYPARGRVLLLGGGLKLGGSHPN